MEELWKENIEYYREMIDRHKWDQEPMVNLIVKLEKAGLCKLFYPSNSHESLVLSIYGSFNERIANPRVLITYKSLSKSFTIAYRNKYDDIIYDNNCESEIMESKFDKIKEWLISTD